MSNFDPTTNRISFGMLTTEEQQALKAWPHGWQIFYVDGKWLDMLQPSWNLELAYRGKPAPVVKQVFVNVYPDGPGPKRAASRQEALDNAVSNSIGMICVEIIDDKLIKSVEIVKGEN